MWRFQALSLKGASYFTKKLVDLIENLLNNDDYIPHFC